MYTLSQYLIDTFCNIDIMRYYWYHLLKLIGAGKEMQKTTVHSWATRIKARMKELEITQEQLANKLGITRGAVTHYLAGRRAPPLRQFQKLAAVLKADPAWLQFGTTVGSASFQQKHIEKKGKTEASKYPIPILTWEQVTEFSDVSKLNHDEISEWLPHFYTDKSRWYALRVTGDSMTAPHGQRNFHDGDIIIVDPDQTAKHGNFVIALLPKSKQATFKQLVVDGGINYLKPVNPQYPLISINDSTHILGVVFKCLTL